MKQRISKFRDDGLDHKGRGAIGDPRNKLSGFVLCIIAMNIAALVYSTTLFVQSRKELGIVDSYKETINFYKNKYNSLNVKNDNYLPLLEQPFTLFNDTLFSTSSSSPFFSSSSSSSSSSSLSSPSALYTKGDIKALGKICSDEVWCSVEMPEGKTSFYGFEKPPLDPMRWKKAQIHAMNGDQVLLQHVFNHFPSPMDFLDGDRSFRKLHSVADAFLDFNHGLGIVSKESEREKVGGISKIYRDKKTGQPEEQEWEKRGRVVVPKPYDFRAAHRAPVLQVGYTAYEKDNSQWFSGNRLGGQFVDFREFLEHWKKNQDKIEIPFIVVCALNENWGVFSTMFPNRTAAWGQCCNKPTQKVIWEFLNHPKTLMMVINQHSNISHPKIMTIPRGLPLTWEYTDKMVWDSMRGAIITQKRDKLLFAAASSWGKRPQILRCMSTKFEVKDFEGHSDSPKALLDVVRLDRKAYYEKLGKVKFGVSLPGLGYDCFRTWELLTMGVVLVIERGVGLDRMLWRLPALLVEDFDEVNPTMLRQAYVEAIYRAPEFEFNRLSQNYWWGVISNVSATMKVQTILDAFPMRAEDPTFTRPREPYPCGVTDRCGKGTKRTPRKSC